MNRILYVSACVRENSRTLRLAKELLTHLDGEITEVDLNSDKPEFLDRGLLEKREKLLKERDFSDRMFRFARDFSSADEIVVAAPYWDLSIPAILKCYFENVSIPGLTFSYTDDGRVVGLCRAVRLRQSEQRGFRLIMATDILKICATHITVSRMSGWYMRTEQISSLLRRQNG